MENTIKHLYLLTHIFLLLYIILNKIIFIYFKRIVMTKTVHSKTVIGLDGKAETIVTEDTTVEHDDSLPTELQDSVKHVINDFVA